MIPFGFGGSAGSSTLGFFTACASPKYFDVVGAPAICIRTVTKVTTVSVIHTMGTSLRHATAQDRLPGLTLSLSSSRRFVGTMVASVDVDSDGCLRGDERSGDAVALEAVEAAETAAAGTGTGAGASTRLA